MRYVDYRAEKQAEFDKLPIFFAFSNKQFEEQLEKRGIKVEEAHEHIYRLGDTGGFFLKKDAEQVKAVMCRNDNAELRQMMEADLDFAREAFEYEMFNHEYAINWEGDYEVCGCFGHVEWEEWKDYKDYLKELGFSLAVMRVFMQARDYVIEHTEC